MSKTYRKNVKIKNSESSKNRKKQFKSSKQNLRNFIANYEIEKIDDMIQDLKISF